MDTTEKQLVVSNLTVQQLLEQHDSLMKQLEDSDGNPSEELAHACDLVQSLMQGKVDDIVMYQDQLERRMEFCKAQIENDKKELEKLEFWTEKVLTHLNVKALDGNFNRIGTRKSESLIVTDENKIPLEFKKTKVEIKVDFPASDVAQFLLWGGIVLGKQNWNGELESQEEKDKLEKAISTQVVKAELKKFMKTNSGVEGAHIEESINVQFQKGKSKAKKQLEG